MEEQIQQTREHIKSQIPDTINDFLQTVGTTAIRILGDTPNSALDVGDKLGSIRQFALKLEESVRATQPNAETCFLAVNIYPQKHSYFVFDVNNVDYVYETAHTDMTTIPVYVLRLSKRRISIFRQQRLDTTLAVTLAEMHNGHGQDPLPLVDDYNHIVQYKNPRSLSSR
ncbi:unnamed protein product [Penicillium salamii]|nr:unnamed protein product [Penicillium salamii]